MASTSYEDIKNTIHEARKVLQKTRSDLKICFELQENLRHSIRVENNRIETKENESMPVSSSGVPQKVEAPNPINNSAIPVEPKEEVIPSGKVNNDSTIPAYMSMISTTNEIPPSPEHIPREIVNEPEVNATIFDEASKGSLQRCSSPVFNEESRKRNRVPIKSMPSASQLMETEEYNFSDFLIETDAIAGRPRTNLRTLVKSNLTIKKLTPQERVIFMKEQAILEKICEIDEQKKQIESLKAKEKIMPVSKRGVLLKLPSHNETGKASLKKKLGRLILGPTRDGNRYFFVLSERFLLYFSSYPSSSPRQMIDLLGASPKLFKSKHSPTGFELRLTAVVRTPIEAYRKMYRFCPKDADQGISWMRALEINIKAAKNLEMKRQNPEKAQPDDSATNQKRVVKNLVGVDITTQTKELETTLYDILNVPISATDQVLKKRYRHLAMQNHPDKASTEEEREKMQKEFATISKAYSTLKDPISRKEYDLTENVKAGLRLGLLLKLLTVDKVCGSEDSENKNNAEGVDEDDDLSQNTLAENSDDEPAITEIVNEMENAKESVLFIDEAFEWLYWQESSSGPILMDGYGRLELRFVQMIFAGEDFDKLDDVLSDKQRRKCLVISGKRKGCPDLVIEMENFDLRDELLDGLRHLRCEGSMLFKQNLAKIKKQGFR